MSDYEICELGNVVLQSGLTLRQAKLAYKTYGQLNSARDNVIVMPTFYGGQHPDTEAMMSAGRALDPKQYSSSCPICLATVCPPPPAILPHRLIVPLSLTSRCTIMSLANIAW